MADVRLHANRIFRQRMMSDGGRVGLPGYFALTHGERPIWWGRPHEETCANILGVYENHVGSADMAIIVAGDRIVLLLKSGTEEIPYADIDRIDEPSKEPMSSKLAVHLKSGSIVEVPFPPKTGAIFTFLRFLRIAANESRFGDAT